jgi:hypothetical protein
VRAGNTSILLTEHGELEFDFHTKACLILLVFLIVLCAAVAVLIEVEKLSGLERVIENIVGVVPRIAEDFRHFKIFLSYENALRFVTVELGMLISFGAATVLQFFFALKLGLTGRIKVGAYVTDRSFKASAIIILSTMIYYFTRSIVFPHYVDLLATPSGWIILLFPFGLLFLSHLAFWNFWFLILRIFRLQILESS